MRVGIVGCGHICEQHFRVLRRLRGVEVIGVCDRQLDRALAFKDANRLAGAFDDVDTMVHASSLEVVHVLTPPQSHRDVAIRALKAGCHVLVEKPMAMSTDEAREMLEVAQMQGRQLGVCHNYRFVPAYLEAQEQIKRGTLGRIVSADVYWKMSSYRADLRGDAIGWMRELPGGPFVEVLPHLIYTLYGIMGELTLVSVISCGAAGAGQDTELRAVFSSANGPVTLAVSLASNPVQKMLRIHGTNRSLHIDLATSTLLQLRAPSDTTISRALVNAELSRQLAAGLLRNAVRAAAGGLPRGHQSLIARFYAAMRCKDAPPAGGEEGLATVAVLEQLYTALEQNAKRRA